MNNEIISLYVDTNVLINYCTGQEADVSALEHIFSKRRKEVLFTSSLAVVQTISKLQSKNKNREAFSRDIVINKLDKILKKFTVLNLTISDIENAFKQLNNDVEDSVHYILSKKMNCNAILTNNIKDFLSYGVIIISPNKKAFLKSAVQ